MTTPVAVPIALVTLVASIPASSLITFTAFMSIAALMPVLTIPVARAIMVVAIARTGARGWPSIPLRRRIAQKVNRFAASTVAPAMATPVTSMAWRHPHIDRLHLRHHRATPHRLCIHQWRRGVTNIDLTVDTGSQLARDRAVEKGLRLTKAGSAHHGKRHGHPEQGSYKSHIHHSHRFRLLSESTRIHALRAPCIRVDL